MSKGHGQKMAMAFNITYSGPNQHSSTVWMNDNNVQFYMFN